MGCTSWLARSFQEATQWDEKISVGNCGAKHKLEEAGVPLQNHWYQRVVRGCLAIACKPLIIACTISGSEQALLFLSLDRTHRVTQSQTSTDVPLQHQTQRLHQTTHVESPHLSPPLLPYKALLGDRNWMSLTVALQNSYVEVLMQYL